MAAPSRISSFLQQKLASLGLAEVAAAEAARWLDGAGLLDDSPDRPGKPLRALLRDGLIEGAEQRPPSRNGRWFIVLAASGSVEVEEPARTDRPEAVQAPVVDVEAETARVRHRPNDVRVLFVGESRPAGGSFFYFANSLLYEATRDAFVSALPDISPDTFLPAFKEAGCYLEDLCSEPVNRMPQTDREAARERGESQLAERLGGLNPDVVIIVMKAIEPHVRSALAQAGLQEVPTVSVPFPRPEWRRRYVDEVARELAAWRQSRPEEPTTQD